MLACLLRNNLSRIINENFWFFKIAFVIGIFVAFMYVSNDFFITYAKAAKWIGLIFLLFQLGMIIDINYLVGERLVRLYDLNYSCMGFLLIALSLAIYAGLIYINVKMFTWFPCHVLFNTINILLTIAVTLLSVSGISPNGSIITSGLTCIYQTFLLWVALTNEDEAQCNLWYKDPQVMKIDIGLGSFFIFSALLYITLQDADSTQR